MPGPGFLDLPVRSAKPRRTGITHVLDRGIPLAQVRDLLEQNSRYIVGWTVQYRETAQIAAALIEQAAEQQQITPKILTLHCGGLICADATGCRGPTAAVTNLPNGDNLRFGAFAYPDQQH